MTINARYGLWIMAMAVSPMLFAACGDDEDDGGGGGKGGKGGEAGQDTGGSGGSGATGGSGGSGARGGSAGMGGGTSGAAGAPGGEGGMGGGEGGMGGSGAAGPGAREVHMTPARFFPEGVALDRNGNFYLGSMDLGIIYKATAWTENAAPFISSGDIVSVLGMYAEDGDGSSANPGTLWVCASDAGNAALSGAIDAPVALKAFNLMTGALVGTWDWPAPDPADPTAPDGINGFCNDITVDSEGNLYATDSWYPRILRLPKAGRSPSTPLEEWVTNDDFGTDKWHLNGIDVDQATRTLYVVENHPGHLWSIPINTNGSAGTVTEIATSQPLGGPDGLKVIAPNLLATAENNGVSLIAIDGDEGEVTEIFHGFDGVATIALHEASVWIVENQGDHFWDPTNAGPNADPPFRLVEVPITVGAGARNIATNVEDFFSEGSTVDGDGNLYVGSMQLGSIHRAEAGDAATAQFIAPGAQSLVSVIGMNAHTASNRLWVCSSDTDVPGAPNGPTTLKLFDLDDGGNAGSFDWPAPTTTQLAGTTANGFCNDITVNAAGTTVYATDSWYPRIVRLQTTATGAATGTLTTWLTDTVFNAGTTGAATQWHLNGIDLDPTGANLFVVENHPGHLWRVAIDGSTGNPGAVTEIVTSRPLRGPDGLKVINATTLAVAEGSGMAIITLSGNTGQVRTINTGLDGIATFALLGEAAWIVENQADHFWGASGPQGGTANKPFRLVEVPLGL